VTREYVGASTYAPAKRVGNVTGVVGVVVVVVVVVENGSVREKSSLRMEVINK